MVEKYIAVDALGSRCRYDLATLRQICQSGLVEAKNVGRRWFLSEADLEERLLQGELSAYVNSLQRFHRLRLAVFALAVFVFVSGALISFNLIVL